MPSKLEQEFYDTFGIEKTSFDFICNKNKCNKKRLFGRFSCLECDNETKKEIKVYPEITTEKLLKMEDILLRKHIQMEYCFYNGNYYSSCTIALCNGKSDNKKDAFLEMLISIAQNFLDNCDTDGEEEIYKQIQQLFKD